MGARGTSIAAIGAAVLIAGVAVAQGTTLVGTKAGNLIIGSKGADRLVGKGGGDLLKGLGGNDRLSGGRGRDLLTGGAGADRLNAGPTRDGIKAADGRRDRLINGGPGNNVCVIDIPADLPVTRNCGTIRTDPTSGGGAGGGGGGGGPADPNLLEVTSAQGLTCLPLLGCLFTVTGKGADALVGTVAYGGALSSVTATAVNDVVLATWLATGTYSCSAPGMGWIVVTMGSKSTPQIPVQCG
jgi:Ca2+-binding RTX toxin-like protein